MITFASSSRPGSYGIIASGSFSLPHDAWAVTIPLNDLRYTLRFERGGGGSPRVELVNSDEKSVTLSLLDFDSHRGTAFESVVGLLDDKQTELSLIVTPIKGNSPTHSPRVITYTFFQRIA